MPDSYGPPPCSVIMLGCRALDNVPPAPGDCPVCGPGVIPGHDNRYCSKCDSVSPATQKDIDRALRVERIGVEVQTRIERAKNKAKTMLRALENSRPILSESDRRKMWNGYKGCILRELVNDLPNLANDYRNFLRKIGQEPNWSLVLDGRGNITGIMDSGITA